MIIEITGKGLLIALFSTLGVALIGFLFITLSRINEILKQFKMTLEKNDKNINDSIEALPKLLNNLEEITAGVNEEMKHIQETVRSIEETAGYAASTAQLLTEDIVEPVRDLLEILGVIKGIFFKEKKKGWLQR